MDSDGTPINCDLCACFDLNSFEVKLLMFMKMKCDQVAACVVVCVLQQGRALFFKHDRSQRLCWICIHGIVGRSPRYGFKRLSRAVR